MTDKPPYPVILPEQIIPSTIPVNAGTNADDISAPISVAPSFNAPSSIQPDVLIPGTASTPPVSLSADEHQLLADLKASGHDIVKIFNEIVNKA